MNRSILSEVFNEAKQWPYEDQAALAEAARDIEARRTGVYVLTPDERAAVHHGLAQLDRGEVVSEEDVEAMWKRYGV